MNAVGAIDIGSNGVRLAIGSLDNNNSLFIVENYRESIRLGRDVFSSKVITDQSIERLGATLQQFAAILARHGVKRYRAIATAALREAKNREDALERVKKRSGIAVEVIGGDEEAGLISEAILHRIDVKKRCAMFIDVGGGSVEISIVDDGSVILSESVKMGTVRLLQILGEKKRGHKVFNRLLEEYTSDLKRQLKRELDLKPEFAVGTGGNLDTLADLKKLVLGKSNDAEVTLEELTEILKTLQDYSVQERITRFELREDRADVIIPALTVVREIMRTTKVPKILIPRVGLKEGVMLDLLPRSAQIDEGRHRKQILSFGKELGRKFGIDVEHAKHVTNFATVLFDELQGLHGFGAEERLLLEVGAYLHDIGHAINTNNHHRHSAYILRSTPFVGLTPRQKGMVAGIARYHRKSPPSKDHEELTSLTGADRDKVVKLAALVRLCEGIDKGHHQAVKQIKVTRSSDAVSLALTGTGDLLLERWAIMQKADLFEQEFRLGIKVLD
jgi:exopolyphosphatase/guanosine-5'-triphosphate,3'-diphosphate pyrophosphatase